MCSSPIITARVFMPQPPYTSTASRLQNLSLEELLLLLNGENSAFDEIAVIETLETFARAEPASVPTIVGALVENIQSHKAGLRCIVALERIVKEYPASRPAVIASMSSLLDHDQLGHAALNFLVQAGDANMHALLPIFFEELTESVSKRPRNYKLPEGVQVEVLYHGRNKASVCHLESLLKAIETILTQSPSLTTDSLALATSTLTRAWNHEEARRKQRRTLSPISRTVLGSALLALAKRFESEDLVGFLIDKALEQGALEGRDVGSITGKAIMPIFEAAVAALLSCQPTPWIRLRVGELIGFVQENNRSYSIVWMLGKIVRWQQAAVPEGQIPTLVRTIESYLHSEHLQLAGRSMEALGRMWCVLDQDQQGRVMTMLQHYFSPHLGWMMRLAAVQTLGEISVVAAPDIVGKIAVILMEGKDDKGYDVRLAIVQVLHRLVRRSPGQIPRVFTACVGFLSDARAEVREAAAQALQNLIKTNPAYAATQLQTTIEAAGKAIALAPTIFSPLNPYHSHILEIQALHHRAHIAAIQVLRDIATVSLMSQNCYHEGHENA